MVSMMPSCATGTPTAAKSAYAAKADPCCNKRTISLNATCGSGTNPNKKQRGKSNDRETREPKQRTKTPIHDNTRANILIESCSSDGSEADQTLTKPAAKTAIARRAEPARTFGVTIDRTDCHSRKIRAALTGRIRSMYVYSSFRSASAKVATRGRHPTSKETARR